MSQDWFKNGIIYEIFPDSFRLSGMDARAKAQAGHLAEGSVALEWEAEISAGHIGREFFGGDIRGIIDGLDRIQELGADIVYLTPVWRAKSNHRYGAIDYREIDPALGTLEDFTDLLRAVHRRGMRVILDMVFNHCSDSHPWFQEALRDENSEYRQYFKFHSDGSYQCWRNVGSVPEWNLRHPAVLEELFEGRESVLAYWMDTGIDGVRLDCANDLGTEVTSRITEIVRSTNSEAVVIGEVFPFPGAYRDTADAIQNYYFTASILSLINGQIQSRQFGSNTRELNDSLNEDTDSILMLSSHDTPRSLTVLNEDLSGIRLAITALFTLPGIPLVYYGEELGLQGEMDPFNRGAMRWDLIVTENEVYQYYRRMIEIYKRRRELRVGDFIDLSAKLDNGVVAYYRKAEKAEEFSLLILNPLAESCSFRLFVPYGYLFDAIELEDLLSGAKLVSHMGYVDITIEARESSLFVLRPGRIPNYHFFEK